MKKSDRVVDALVTVLLLGMLFIGTYMVLQVLDLYAVAAGAK